MIQEIKYNGLTAIPSDYECDDGNLSLSLGMLPEDGALRPVLPPKTVYQLDDGEKVEFIHQTSSFRHYIVNQTGRMDNVITVYADQTVTCQYPLHSDLTLEIEWTDVDGIHFTHETLFLPAGTYKAQTAKTYDAIHSVTVSIPQDEIFKYKVERDFYYAGSGGYSTQPITSLPFRLGYFTDEVPQAQETLHTFPDGVELHGYNAIGNTLVVLASDGMHYFLWRKDAYVHLGTQMPHLPLTLGLQGNLVSRRTEIEIKGDYSAVQNASQMIEAHYFLTEEDRTRVNESLPGFVNKLLNEEKDANRFVFPFLARWGYETVFGDMLFSPPVLMIPNSGGTVNVETQLEQSADCNFYVSFFSTALDYHLPDMETWKAELDKWRDVITGISFYVSTPIAAYVSDGQYSEVWNDQTIPTESMDRRNAGFGILGNEYEDYWVQSSEKQSYHIHLQTPVITKKEYIEKFSSASIFWKVATVKLDDLKTNALVPMAVNTVANLGTQEHIESEALNEHDTLIPRYSFVYNSRLNIAHITRCLHAFPAETLVTRWDGRRNQIDYRYTFYVYCNDSGGQQVVKCVAEGTTQATTFHWLYYPNPSAYKMIIEQIAEADGTKKYAEVTLKEHPMLNGAYWFSGFQDLIFETDVSFVPPAEQPLVDNPNKIYTSEVNTPFYFPTLGINTVGTGPILGISTAAKALSQGQFGQFPLYAFSTDGVWALEVSSTGTYSAKQPITRDVCINPDSITQIDSAVLFATDRGIMLISGSETVCLSDNINSRDLFSLSDLSAADKLVNVFNHFSNEQERITLENVSLLPFREFLAGCRMIYDYTGQRIFVYNPSVTYAYVYSLKSKAWGMIHSKITDNVNAYPDALAMVSGNKLANFSTSDAEGITALIVTRPFKLGQPDLLKTIDTIIQRGYFRRRHVAQVLYGSRNLFDWHLVWSSTDEYLRGFRGTPYKYFRLALICQLDKHESLYGCTVQFTPRLTNQPR